MDPRSSFRLYLQGGAVFILVKQSVVRVIEIERSFVNCLGNIYIGEVG